jgi:hypothetical protein
MADYTSKWNTLRWAIRGDRFGEMCSSSKVRPRKCTQMLSNGDLPDWGVFFRVSRPGFFEVHADFAMWAFFRASYDRNKVFGVCRRSALDNKKSLYLRISSSRLPVFCSPLV